jgi:hypothetical protein
VIESCRSETLGFVPVSYPVVVRNTKNTLVGALGYAGCSAGFAVLAWQWAADPHAPLAGVALQSFIAAAFAYFALRSLFAGVAFGTAGVQVRRCAYSNRTVPWDEVAGFDTATNNTGVLFVGVRLRNGDLVCTINLTASRWRRDKAADTLDQLEQARLRFHAQDVDHVMPGHDE